MHVINIHSKNDIHKLKQLNDMIDNGSNVFILVYMEGCGPCNATRPEWKTFASVLKEQYKNNNNLVIVDVNKDFSSDIKHIGSIDGFPTMKYISKKGAEVEPYESSSISKKDRSSDSFINWLESKMNTVVSTTSSPEHVFKRLTKHRSTHKRRGHKKTQKGGKWSKKYKASINCRRPKGFSQRQHCKYGRHKK
jgi:thiol-disulfide isomerase/thioredoxin